MKAKKTRLSLTYINDKETDISVDINKYLISATLNDNENGKLDDISITLDNKDGLWSGSWRPQKTDKIRFNIIQIDENENETQKIGGLFSIDELSSSFPPKNFTIKGVSVPLANEIRRQKKTVGYEEVKLSEIAGVIASAGGIELQYIGDLDPFFKRIDQVEKTDLEFLKKICDDYSLSIKLTSNKLVIFDQKEIEKNSVDHIISYSFNSDLISGNFQSKATDLYKTAIVSYFDPELQELVKAEFVDNAVISGETISIKKRCESVEQAQQLAIASLKKHNNFAETCSLKLNGNVKYYAGNIVELTNFELDSGTYLIEKVTDTISSNGYTTDLTLRRITK